MQRRAAAIYAVLFLVIGAASYSLIATAQEPEISFENPDYRLSQNESFTVEGQQQQYTVSSIEASMESSGGGHGGGGGELTRSGEITWTIQSAEYNATWENNSTVTLNNQTNESYRVLIPNQSNPNSFTLQEEINESQVLQNDPNADNETITRDGQKYVVVQNGNDTTLVPADEYFPDPQTQRYSEGDSLNYQGNQSTVENVTAESVTVTWTGPRTSTAELSEGGRVNLDGQEYLVHFPNNQTVVLTQDFQSYKAQNQDIAQHHQLLNSLWSIIALCGITAVLLLAMAYLPSRY
ncbi:hypothetical protein [Halegenticoccus soli]|uniref:hypothetical protein n=1 Tax=Halegenticoccus soli TaxID=1985678 RepID=UPI000C6E2A7A|nr:hypothetical protein [Halegenticoccus soli]